MNTRFVIVMGVAGSGKTTVGKALARRLKWDFYDADEFHPIVNIDKMAAGVPLDDSDRDPWLTLLHTLISTSLHDNRLTVLACSALKRSYRQRLLDSNNDVTIVYLKGDYDLVWPRIAARQKHYMKPQMLQSQFAALEEPEDVLTVDASMSVNDIVMEIVQKLKLPL